MNEKESGQGAVLTGTEGRWRQMWPLVFCAVTACGFMAICTKSSPLYPMNDWPDVNCFHTMGRAVLEGKVLYRDIYEQKGPLLYFIYALLAAVTPRSFLSVYLMECACFCAFLYGSGKCAGLYLKSRWMICALLLLLAAAVGPCRAFTHGGSVEEMCLFMAVWSLYMTLRAVEEKRPIPGRDAFVIGLFAGAAFWIKYTLCGFYFGLALFVALYHLLGLRQPRALLAVIGRFLLGLAAVTGPILLYFAVNGALDDLFRAYFYDNYVIYSSTDKKSLLTMAENAWENTSKTYRRNRAFMALAVLGLLGLGADVRRRPWQALAAVMTFVATAFFVFSSMYILYYGLYLAAFSVFGLIALGRLWQWAAERLPVRLPGAVSACLCAALGAGLLVYAWRTSPNTYLLGYEKEDMPQYQFAQIIDQVPDATLLNYGFLDGGFYFASGVEPVTKYFCELNIRLPDMLVELTRYTRTQMVDFVVVMEDWYRDLMDGIPEYRRVGEASVWFVDQTLTYYLYQKN